MYYFRGFPAGQDGNELMCVSGASGSNNIVWEVSKNDLGCSNVFLEVDVAINFLFYDLNDFLRLHICPQSYTLGGSTSECSTIFDYRGITIVAGFMVDLLSGDTLGYPDIRTLCHDFNFSVIEGDVVKIVFEFISSTIFEPYGLYTTDILCGETPSITPTPSATYTFTESPSPTRSATVTPTVTPSSSQTPSSSKSPSRTSTLSRSLSPTSTVTKSSTATPSSSSSRTPSRTETPTSTHSPSPTITSSVTASSSRTASSSSSFTSTGTSSITPSITLTSTGTMSMTSTPTNEIVGVGNEDIYNDPFVSPSNSPSSFISQSKTPSTSMVLVLIGNDDNPTQVTTQNPNDELEITEGTEEAVIAGGDDIRSNVVNIKLVDPFGNYVQPESSISICLSAQSTDEDLCLGSFNEDTGEWQCDDHCLEEDSNGQLCGDVDHLTNFALLLSDGRGGGGCGSSGDGYILGSAFNDSMLIMSVTLVVCFCAILMVLFLSTPPGRRLFVGPDAITFKSDSDMVVVEHS